MARPKPLTFAELHALLPRLAATAKLLEGLAGTPAVAATRTASNGTARPARGRRRRSADGGAKLQSKLLAVLKKSKSGMSLGDVVKQARASKPATQYNLRVLRAQKKVRVVGDRRVAKWFAA